MIFLPSYMRLPAILPRHIYGRLGIFLACSILIASLTGCGYTLVGAAPGASAQRIMLTVLPFTNQTREPGLDGFMTTALRQAIIQSHAFMLVSGSSGRRIQGTVRRFRFFPLSFDEHDNVLQYRLEADVLVRLLEGVSPVPAWEQEISAWAEYLVSNSSEMRQTVVAKQVAIVRLAQQFADRCTTLLAMTLL
jgi:hypothetical protein